MSQVAVSPDGEHVAFIGTPRSGHLLGTSRLVLAGDQPKDLTPGNGVARVFSWMPESKSILVGYADEPGGDHPNRFAIVNLSGDVERAIDVDLEQTGDYGLAVSPDSSVAVFPASDPGPLETSTTLWQIELSTGHMTAIEVIGFDGDVLSPRFLDSDRLVVAGGVPTWEADGPNGWIGVLDLVSGQVRRLTGPDQTAGTPTLSPDGRYALYDAFPENRRSERSLWYVPVDGSESPRLMIDNIEGLAPFLEPAGSSVLVVDAGSPGDQSVIRRLMVPTEVPWLDG